MSLRAFWVLTCIQLVHSAVFVNPAQRIFLDGQATHVGANHDIQNVTWTVMSGAFASGPPLIGLPTSRVVGIKENSLLPNQTYIFRFSGRVADGSTVHDEVVFSSLPAPSQGSISVFPTSGIVGSTEFSISTSGWLPGDDSGLPLKYRFSYSTNASMFEVPLTVFSLSPVTRDIVFEPLHLYATEVTIVARAMNSLGVVGNPVFSDTVVLYPNPSLLSATAGLLQRWQLAVQAQNLTSILRSGCLLSAVIADTNSTGLHPDTEYVLDTMKDSLANFSAMTYLTVDIADLASHAVAQAALSLARNDSSHVEATLSILQQITAAAAVDPQAVTENGTISQGMVISPEFANNAVKTFSTVMSTFLDDRLPRPAVDIALGNALDAVADRHVVGRVCGEDLVISAFQDVQLVAGIQSGASLSSMLLQLPSGSWSLPSDFFMQFQTPFNESCVPIRAYVLPLNIEASNVTVKFYYNSTNGDVPQISQAGPEMGPDQAALFDVSGNYGFTEGSMIQYLRFGDDDTGIDGVKFNFSGGMVVTFQLQYPITGNSVRCAYKENILDAWQSDDTCQLTSLNDTHAECTCYHASAVVIQSAPVCYPRTCWEVFWIRFINCNTCYKSYACGTYDLECMPMSDGCGGNVACGFCGPDGPAGQLNGTCLLTGCVPLNHSASLALMQDKCGDQCGNTMFHTGGSTVCTCSAGYDCVAGTCKLSPTCADLNFTCGVWPNGQGGVVGPCGNCTSGQYCNNGTCVASLATTAVAAPCTPLSTCPDDSCGRYPDGCGGHLNCGNCPGQLSCNATNGCEKKCKTCWDMYKAVVQDDICPCFESGDPIMLATDLSCTITPDYCGNQLLCGFCTGEVGPKARIISDCTPKRCVAYPYNEADFEDPIICTRNCSGRCGYISFNGCGSKLCVCPAGQACNNGYCATVQRVGVNWAASFDGALGYWTGSSVVDASTSNFTLSFWVYPNGVKTKDQYLFYNGVAKTNGWGLKIPANYPMNISVLLGGTGSPPTQAPFAYSLPIQRWTYITVTCANGSNWFLYENATLMGSFTLPKTLIPPTTLFTVGGSWDAGQNGNFDGRIDELQLYQPWMLEPEILITWLSGVGGFEPKLLMFLPFSEGVGTTTSLVGTGASLGVTMSINGTLVNWAVRVNNTNDDWASSGGVNKRNVGMDPASRSGRQHRATLPSAPPAVRPPLEEEPDELYAAGSMRSVGLVSENHVQSQPVGKRAPVLESPASANDVAAHPLLIFNLIASGAALLLAVWAMYADRRRAAAAAVAAGPAPPTPEPQTCDGSSVSAGVVDAAVASQTSEPAPETPPASPKKERGGNPAVCLPASPASPANAKAGETVIRHRAELNSPATQRRRARTADPAEGAAEGATESQAELAAALKHRQLDRVASSSLINSHRVLSKDQKQQEDWQEDDVFSQPHA
eukprot:TRINITY_DN55_c0_g2_i1.p1 TRINITY_DN55_c0_g2~~TRINITY_DN55_c0_g2_i1.p1  ORF type:complete len:1425 (-),score=61.11 TRINITY_DN55_c0_g2_i1:587-4861(-)